MLTAIQIMYVFIALQEESNLTNPFSDILSNPLGLFFSSAAAAGSITTALALIVIVKQFRLTKEEVRPWIGTTDIRYTSDKKEEVRISLKNFGRFPGRILT